MSSLIQLTVGQRDELIALLDECRARGASASSLAPIYEVLGLSEHDGSCDPLTNEVILAIKHAYD